MYDTSNELHNQRKIFDTLTSRGATLNALSSVMDKYKAFLPTFKMDIVCYSVYSFWHLRCL